MDTLEFPMWGASDVTLYSDSRIEVTVENQTFVPDAILSGKMNISASLNKSDGNSPGDGTSLQLAQIKFQQLHITTEKPYLYLDPANGAFSVGSNGLSQKMSKLPITLKEVGLVTRTEGDKDLTGVLFTLRVNLTGNDDAGKGFGANATAIIFCEKPDERWKYYRCELQRLELEQVNIGPMTLAGYIEFFRQDDVYGSGFTGGISCNIKLKEGSDIGLEVKAIFGKKMDESNPSILLYRYWAVDALANFPKIPVIPSLLYANGFGGGASYRMSQVESATGSEKYQTLSGIGYEPDEEAGLGLRAMMSVQGEMASVYNGEVAFEILFTSSGSLDNITFSGYVAIASKGSIAGIDVSKVKNMASKVEAKVSLSKKASDSEVKQELDNSTGSAIMAQWLMVMDFTNKTFSADIDVFVDVENVITGVNEYNNAGRLSILFAPEEWYIHAGKPSLPMGLNILGVHATSYVVMGSTIPPPTQPQGFNGTWAFASDVKAGSVKGFGFGARLSVEKRKDGTFYYVINTGVGFDVLLRNVQGLVCAETGQPFGIKDWYATGMAYMFVDIKAGLEICLNVPYLKCWKAWKPECWGTRRVCSTTALETNMSASVTVNAPNPTNLALNTKILGKNVSIKVGETCSF